MIHSNSLGFLPPQDPRWLDFIQSNPRASLFHHPSWINLLALCYGYQGFVLTLPASQNEIRAGVPIMELNITERFEKGLVWKLQVAHLLETYL
jgi:hypothetical protein